MSSGRLASVMRRLVDVALADGGGLSDGALLERYLNLREEAAFAALVRIHGPMVLGVCRRVLGNVHDADDAFQATFLVLVRKGQTIVPRERVGPWLYGVAYRTALKANAMAKRRRGKQVKLEDVPGRSTEPEAEWLALLDQEINRLPEKYRAPLVLCDLEGKTRKQAAKLLGCPEGTVATRLQHARGLIHKRLARHGLPAAASATALALGQAASAKVPFALLKATVKHAILFAAGTSAGAIPLKIIVLMEGVLNAMVLTKIKTATALLVLAGALGVGGFAGKVYVAADDAPLPPPVTNPLSPPLSKGGPGGVVERQADSKANKESDLLLPKGPPPVQVYVSLVDDMLVMKRRTTAYNAKTTLDASGRPTTSFVPFDYVSKNLFSRNDLKMALKMVLEVQRSGQRVLDSEEWRKRIKGEALALAVEVDFDPAHLRLIKEGTLVFVAAGKYVVVPNPEAPIAAQAGPVQPPLVLPAAPPAVLPPSPPLPIPANVGPPPPLEDRKSTKLPVDWLKSLLPGRYDFGTAEQGKLLRHSIALVNKNAKMEITNVRVSCGCLSAQVSKTVIPPGEGATLELILDTRRFSGHKKMSVFVNVIADGKPYEFQTIITATSARPEDLPKPAVGSAPGPIQGSPVNPPAPFSASPPPDNLSQFNAQTMQQANRDLAALKFYVKTGHAGSAVFYRDLIQRRYPDSLYSQQAEQLVRDMKQPAPSVKGKVCVGQVIIVGNEHLPDAVIRQTLGFYPGAPLEYKDLPAAEERLNRLRDVGMPITASVIVLDTEKQAEFRDILVQVREFLDDATRADFNKLQGTWTVISTSLQGKAQPSFVKEVGFQGNEITTKNSKTETRGFFLLNPPSEPKRMRILANEGTTPDFKYEFKGEQLKLSFPIEFKPSSTKGYLELTLKRKQPGETLQPAPARKAATRIGAIIIVGNDYLPDTVIRKALGIYPPQIIEEKDLHAAEERANRLNEGGIRLAATVHVLDAGKSEEFRDIRVDVRELLSSATRADFNKLQGTWTVVSASFQGKADRDLADADFVFKGAELTATNKDTFKEQFKFLLNPSALPKEIRLYPLDGTSVDGTSAPARGTYEMKGDTLLLRVGTPVAASTQMMELTLKRQQPLAAPPPTPAQPRTHSETFLSDPPTASPQTMATRIFFKTWVPADKSTNLENALAYTDVELFHMPAKRLTAKMDRDHLGKDAFYLKCASLKIFPRAANNNIHMLADGTVSFREQNLFATAAVVKYNETDDQLIFEGTPDQPAILHIKQPGQAEDQEIKGNQIVYNRKTGALQVAGGITIAN